MNEVSVVSDSQAAGFLQLIDKVVSNPNSSIDMLDKILDAQERVMNKQAEMAFNAGLAVMLNEIPVIAKTSEAKVTTKAGGSFGIKYASLDEIVEVVRPVLSRHGFSVNFEHTQPSSDLVKIICVLRHKEGHSISNEIVLPIDVSGAKNSVQSVGSTITYGKRYTLCSALNIATGDDRDGFTVKANQANSKIKMDDARLEKAIESIKSGQYSLYRLFSDFELTANHTSRLDQEFNKNAK